MGTPKIVKGVYFGLPHHPMDPAGPKLLRDSKFTMRSRFYYRTGICYRGPLARASFSLVSQASFSRRRVHSVVNLGGGLVTSLRRSNSLSCSVFSMVGSFGQEIHAFGLASGGAEKRRFWQKIADSRQNPRKSVSSKRCSCIRNASKMHQKCSRMGLVLLRREERSKKMRQK